MKTNTSRRAFLKFGGLATAAGLMQFTTGSKAFASPAPRDFGAVRFAVISDPHVDIKGKNDMKMSAISRKCLRSSVDAVNAAENVAFTMICGDLLLDGERENAQAVKAELDRLSSPYFVIAGNHDFAPVDTSKHRPDFTYLTIEQFVDFFQGHGYGADGKRHWVRDVVPGLRVIGLDANKPLEMKNWGGVIPPDQLSWLDDQLSANADSLHLIFIHHTLVNWTADELQGGPKEWFVVDNAPDVRAVLAKHSKIAPVVVSGHRHIGLNVKELGGVTYFTSPSVNSYPMRYSIYDMTPQSISWQTPAVPVETAAQLEARENLLNATWWRPTQFAERNSFNDMEVLSLYENNGLRMGRKGFKA